MTDLNASDETPFQMAKRLRAERIAAGGPEHPPAVLEEVDPGEFAADLAAEQGQADWGDTLPIIDMSGWDDTPPPPRLWAVAHTVPLGEVTLLTGRGGVGKSLAAQQLATCVVMGRDFLGVATRRTRAMYLTWEDDVDELRRRQASICKAIGTTHAALSGKLDLVSLKGRYDGELARFDPSGCLVEGDTWRQITAHLDHAGVGFLVLDNASHAMIGDHNAVQCVVPFLALLESATARLQRSIMLVHHTNKAGDDWLGSVAYENQVRSRLILSRDEGDRELLKLANPKANYAAGGDVAAFRWQSGAFLRDDDLDPSTVERLRETSKAAGENARFMECLTAATAAKRAVSHNPGVNYYGAIFPRMTEARGMKRDAFERAFERLLHLVQIELDAPLWQDTHRHWKQGIRVSEKCGNPPAGTPCGDLREPLSQVIENTVRQTRAATPPLLRKGIDGPEGPPSIHSDDDEDPDDPANFMLGKS